jgi:tetratricopeptide (TPR) repeat protein
MKVITCIIAGLLLTGLSITAQTREPLTQARDTLNRGVSAFRTGDYEAAMALFKQAVAIDPDFTVGEVYLAAAYAQRYVPGVQTRENLTFAENAIESFKLALRQDPNNINALMGLASIYQNSNRLQDARETYLTASKSDPQNAIAFYSVGAMDWILVYDKNKPLPFGQQSMLIDEGLASLDSALALNPQYEDAMTYKNLLFREKAQLAVDPAEKTRLTALADEWFNKALETRKLNAEIRRAAPVGAPAGGFTGRGPVPPPPPPNR